MFEIEIAGQMAAWFLRKQTNRMPHLKLIKLLYLAERTSIKQNNYPILGDKLVSMPHGPVLSMTLDYMQGNKKPGNGWDKWVAPKENHEVSLAKEFDAEELDMLSDATLEILEYIWEKFGNMDQWEISDYTHNNCTEWKDPKNSSFPITYEQLLKCLGYEGKKAKKLALELEAQQEISESLLSFS